jgi:hypothetical protein
MSLEKKSIHVRLDAEMHRKIKVLADMADKDVVEVAAVLIEEAIAGEWHQFQCGLERMKALGIRGD